jgi:PhnB protein
MNVQPYVFFDGKCEEALEFYKGAIGAKVDAMMRFEEGPPMEAGEGCAGGPQPDPKKIMHAAFKVGDTQILASDGMCGGKPTFQGFSLTITAANDAEADKLFNALGKGGQVQMPMAETFFASRFGMVADKFGVSWMVLAEKQPN